MSITLYTRKTPKITTGISPYTRKTPQITTGINDDARKMAIFTTGKSFNTGVNANCCLFGFTAKNS
jgi:hypothetical protein